MAPMSGQLAHIDAQDSASVVEFTLQAQIAVDPPVSYIGVGGDIDGVINPDLNVSLGDTVRIILINGADITNDLVIDEFGVASDKLTAKDETTTVEFVADQAGTFNYYGTAPGFRMIGMEGNLIVTDSAATSTDTPAQAAPAVVEFTLETVTGGDPAMHFVGVGGDIDGVVNPELVVNLGDTVKLTVINGAAVMHDLVIDEFNVSSGEMLDEGQTVTVEFVADKPGTFYYYCSVPGHRQIGMEGILRVVGSVSAGSPAAMEASQTDTTQHDMSTMTTPSSPDAVSVVRNPADLPGPIGDREPQNITIELDTIEVEGVLDDGTTFHYMTFGGQVPGPMLRVRVGDTIDLHLHNPAGSHLPHSIDLHAVTGPGGGAVYTQTLPGEDNVFHFTALQPGLYVYHCATASIPHHISSGMYGLILVEPEGGLPLVDREFYVMQGEIYTAQPFGTDGLLDFDFEKMLDEDPEYYIFNGSAGALATDENAMRANVGETVRIYFGVGGPNKISSFHLIGEIFDRVYDQASLTSAPLTDVQTTLVPPGGATMVEFKLDVPGRYILVDHALSRLERGLVGLVYVEGEDNPEIFSGAAMPEDSGH
jgi:nitrite reductase (NO-forming)